MPRSHARWFALVLDTLPIIVWATDVVGVIRLSKGATLRKIGYEPDELVGANVFDLYRNEPWLIDSFKRCLAGESFWGRLHVVSGEVQFRTHFEPLYNGGHAVIGMAGVSVLQEVSAMQRRTNENLSELRAMLYESVG